MVQVLERTAGVLEILGNKGPLQLKDITDASGLNKTTLSNILKTLVKIGYVEQDMMGAYGIGTGLVELARPVINRTSLMGMAEEHTSALAQATQEAAVLTIYDNGEMLMIAKSVFEQTVTVNQNAIKKYSPYSTATGRVLLAHLREAEVSHYIKSRGLPKKNEWSKAGTAKGLQQELARIRKEKFELKEGDQIAAMAVPVVCTGGKVCAALGLFMPLERFKGAHKKEVINALKTAGKRLTGLMSSR